MTHLMIAGGTCLLLLALILVFNHGAQALIFHAGFQSHPIPGWLFYCPLTRGGKERIWESSTKASRNTDACTGAWA